LAFYAYPPTSLKAFRGPLVTGQPALDLAGSLALGLLQSDGHVGSGHRHPSAEEPEGELYLFCF